MKISDIQNKHGDAGKKVRFRISKGDETFREMDALYNRQSDDEKDTYSSLHTTDARSNRNERSRPVRKNRFSKEYRPLKVNAEDLQLFFAKSVGSKENTLSETYGIQKTIRKTRKHRRLKVFPTDRFEARSFEDDPKKLPAKKRGNPKQVGFSNQDSTPRESRNLDSTHQQEKRWITANVFYLLARHGNHLRSKNFVVGEWSSEKFWFLTSIRKDGSPWKTTSIGDFLRSFLKLSRYENLSPSMKAKKMESLRSIENVNAFREEEWELYVQHRVSNLRYAGHKYLKQLVDDCGKLAERSTRGSFQGMVWAKNSCAMDAALSVLPHICCRAIAHMVYATSIHGSNGGLHAPAAWIVSGFKLLQREPRQAALTSSWIRHLAQDIVRYPSDGESVRLDQAYWSHFSETCPFMDITQVVAKLIPIVLGGEKTSFYPEDAAPSIREIPFGMVVDIFEGIGVTGDTDANLPLLLWNSFKRGVGGLFESFPNSLCLLHIPSGVKEQTAGMILRNLYREWRRSFEEAEGAWQIELVSLVGPSIRSKQHFVSATCHYVPEQHFQFHDGMEDGGIVRKAAPEDILQNQAGGLAIAGTFLIFIVSKETLARTQT